MADYTIKRNDTAPAIEVTLKDANGPIDLTNAKAIHIYLKSASLLVKTSTMTVVDAEAGEVKYVWQKEDLKEAGTYDMEFEITWEDDTVTTIPSTGYNSLEVEADLAQPADLE